MNRVTLLCGSRKPAPGVERPSSARQLLLAVQAGLSDEHTPFAQLDLRDLDIPQFDGRTCAEYGNADLDKVRAALDASDVIVVSAPAYWNAVSGPLLNLFNVLGGANYDLTPDRELPLQGKVVILLVVGADHSSAHLAAAQLRSTLSAMGAWVAPRETVIGNPRQVPDFTAVVRDIRELGRYVATVGLGGER
ncbi:NAD(P)H-dependent oxidoreductase [Streptomyces sp. CB02460]|uniref:NAD(P)H-dependent oxidoreductase n=1 Tax=Streptomyces sp. CB02460 TaxID=1703941 RepID=UPI00093A9E3B|nr:NAD(P)H-dependent oxidoreductase [Streptomyces sp. CB02460]